MLEQLQEWAANNYGDLYALGCPVMFILGANMLENDFWRRMCLWLTWTCIVLSAAMCLLAAAWHALLWPAAGLFLWTWVSTVYGRGRP